jgi:hypothetical protein
MLEPARMPPAARTELALDAPCRTCGRPLPHGRSVCDACGAAHGEANRCPHCSALADVETHPALGFRCLVCGGPRIATGSQETTLSQHTQALLKAAGGEQAKHVMYSAAGLLLVGMGLLAFVVAAVAVAAAAPGLVPTLATYLGASVPLIAGLVTLARAATARQLRGEALRAAQVSALGDVQAVTGVLDAARAALVLRVSPERAELLLAEASVSALLEEAPPARLRVDAPAATLLAEGAAPEQPTTELSEPPAQTLRGDTEK